MKLKTLVGDTVRFDPGTTEIWDGIAHRTAVKALGRRFQLAVAKLSDLDAVKPPKGHKGAYREWERLSQGTRTKVARMESAWESAAGRFAERIVESVERRGPLTRIVLGRKDYARPSDEQTADGLTVSEALREERKLGNFYQTVFVVGYDGKISKYSGPYEIERLRDGAFVEGACKYASGACDVGRGVAVFSLIKDGCKER